MPRKSDEILVVDDERSYAEMLCNLLTEEGFANIMFTNPDEALTWLGTNRCGLILADYNMPQVNGTEFLQRVRESNQTLPVIMISGQMNTKELISVANIGVSLVVEKPIEKDVLLDNIRLYVKPKQSAAKNAEGAKAAPKSARKSRKKVQAVAAEPVADNFSYPAKDLRCSQAGEASKKMLQALWDALEGHNAAVLALPLGAELELIVSDVEHWYKLPPPAKRLSPLMLPETGTDDIPADTLFILDSRYSSQDLRETVATILGKRKKGKPVLVLQRADNAKPVGDIPLVVVPPLAGRVQDIGFYSRSILERVGAAQSLTPDGARVILNYDWSGGNYYELMGALRRAVLMQDTEPINAEAMLAAISSGHGAAAPESATATLADYLAAEQALWFGTHGCMNVHTASEAADVPENRFDKSKPLSKQPLLFPEIS